LIAAGLLVIQSRVSPRWLVWISFIGGTLLFLQVFGLGGVIGRYGLVLDLIGFVLCLLFVVLSTASMLRDRGVTHPTEAQNARRPAPPPRNGCERVAAADPRLDRDTRNPPLGKAGRPEPAVSCQQPPVVRNTQFGDRQRSPPHGRRHHRNRGKGLALVLVAWSHKALVSRAAAGQRKGSSASTTGRA
jgi:hypothetical protein